MSSRADRFRRTAGTALLFGVFALALYLKAIPCLFALAFRTPCPGCGSTRAVVALLHGNLDDVVRYNPFGPVVAVLLTAFGVQGLASIWSHGDLRDVGQGHVGRVLTRTFVVVAALQTTLWVARFFGALGGPVPV